MMKVVSEADHENLGWAFAGGERLAGIWSIALRKLATFFAEFSGDRIVWF